MRRTCIKIHPSKMVKKKIKKFLKKDNKFSSLNQ